MTTMDGGAGGAILKQDGLGRVRTPRAQREEILDQFEASGMSGAAFGASCAPPKRMASPMNAKLTEIALVLDRSDSMESCAEAAIAGFNQFLRDQKLAKSVLSISIS